MRVAYESTKYRPDLIVRRVVNAFGPLGEGRSYRVYEVGADHRTYREWDAYPPNFDDIPEAVRAEADRRAGTSPGGVEWPL